MEMKRFAFTDLSVEEEEEEERRDEERRRVTRLPPSPWIVKKESSYLDNRQLYSPILIS